MRTDKIKAGNKQYTKSAQTSVYVSDGKRFKNIWAIQNICKK